MDYEFLGGNLALDFTNTLHSHGTADPGEDLKTTADLVEWAAQAGLLRGAQANKLARFQAGPARLRSAIALRELLYEIFSRLANGKKPQPQALRNFQSLYQSAIRGAEFHPVADHYRLMWPAATQALERISQEITRSAADLLTSEALTRVRQCSGENCSWLFVDNSRNGMRRWCDMKACGNRAKIRRFRRNLSRAEGKSSGRMDDLGKHNP
jgi:predicted RNA-binding Zn ribbon-like protein